MRSEDVILVKIIRLQRNFNVMVVHTDQHFQDAKGEVCILYSIGYSLAVALNSFLVAEIQYPTPTI